MVWSPVLEKNVIIPYSWAWSVSEWENTWEADVNGVSEGLVVVADGAFVRVLQEKKLRLHTHLTTTGHGVNEQSPYTV